MGIRCQAGWISIAIVIYCVIARLLQYNLFVKALTFLQCITKGKW